MCSLTAANVYIQADAASDLVMIQSHEHKNFWSCKFSSWQTKKMQQMNDRNETGQYRKLTANKMWSPGQQES